MPRHCPPEPGATERCLISRPSTLPALKQSRVQGEGERQSVKGAGSSLHERDGHFLPGEMQKPGSMPEITSRVQGTKKESRMNWWKSEKAPMKSKFLIGTTLK